MNDTLTALIFFLVSIAILIFTFMALKITNLIYTLEDIFGIKKQQNKKLIAIERTISFGELIFLSGIALAFLHIREVAGALLIIGMLVIIIPLGYLWFIEILSDFKKLNGEK